MLTVAAYLIVFLLLVIALLLLWIRNTCVLSAEYLYSIQEILCGPREEIKGPIGKGSIAAEISEIRNLLERSPSP